LINYIITL